MIPYLFKANQTEFNAGFIGTFGNALSCNVTETLNGAFELHMQILNNDPILENIEIGSIVVAKPNQTFGNQPFIIEQMVKHIDGTIDIYAPHMSQHRAKLIPISPFTATDMADMFDKIIANSQETNPFTITTDKPILATNFVVDVPKTLREIMGGSEGSIIDVYGGEWLYNNFDLMLMNRRGRTDSDLKVLYGTNMMEYVETDEFSWSMSYTGILPYYKDEENLVVGDIQYSDHVDEYPYKKTIAYDFSDRFDDVPTKAQLEEKCQTFLNGKGVPHISIDVSFEDLSTLPMYGQLNDNVNYIQLGDTVEVINSVYNTQFRSRVRTLDYDVLLERYNTIRIGDQVETINDVISDISSPGGAVSGGGGGGSGTIIYDGNSSSDPQYAELFMESVLESGTNITKRILDTDGNTIYSMCKFDMLWETAYPNNGTSGGTIDIDLSNYALVLIVFKNVGGWEISNDKYYTMVLRVGASENWAFGLYNNYYCYRYISVQTTGVTYRNGYYNTSATASSASPNVMIPYQVIGLAGKYEKLV